jgi:hypothetical protein
MPKAGGAIRQQDRTTEALTGGVSKPITDRGDFVGTNKPNGRVCGKQKLGQTLQIIIKTRHGSDEF